MAYNPSVNDRSGEILAQMMTGAADAQAQGNMAMVQGIMGGVQSATGAISGNLTDYMLRKQEEGQLASMNLGKMEALNEIAPQYGLDSSMLASLLGDEKDPYRLAGKLSLVEGHLEQQQRLGYLNQQFSNSTALANHRSNLAAQNPRPVPPAQQSWGGFQIGGNIDTSR
jgi:hypothetical protein